MQYWILLVFLALCLGKVQSLQLPSSWFSKAPAKLPEEHLDVIFACAVFGIRDNNVLDEVIGLASQLNQVRLFPMTNCVDAMTHGRVNSQLLIVVDRIGLANTEKYLHNEVLESYLLAAVKSRGKDFQSMTIGVAGFGITPIQLKTYQRLLSTYLDYLKLPLQFNVSSR